MLSKTILSAAFILFVPFTYAATIAQVAAANSALTNSAVSLDSSVVAINAQTPTATKQQVPFNLQTLNLAIVRNQSALTPTTATSDPPSENQVTRSFGLFANTIQELADDYKGALKYLKPIPNLERDTYNQLNYLNTNFGNYANFMVGIVNDSASKTYIRNNLKYTMQDIQSAITAYTT
ncbi:hypothetical protein ACLMJK_003844 [Lecanora helva]